MVDLGMWGPELACGGLMLGIWLVSVVRMDTSERLCMLWSELGHHLRLGFDVEQACSLST